MYDPSATNLGWGERHGRRLAPSLTGHVGHAVSNDEVAAVHSVTRAWLCSLRRLTPRAAPAERYSSATTLPASYNLGVSSIEVDRVVQNKAIAAGAEEWLRDVDGLVASVAQTWALRIGRSLPGGTEAIVLEAMLEDGTPAVLKLGVPRDGDHIAAEALVLRLADGHGCARLLRADVERGALLIERLGPSMFDLGIPYYERIRLLCDAASALWRAAPDCGLRTGAAHGAWLGDEIERRWNTFDRPCTVRTLDHALSCAARRVEAHDDERAVLVHGDVHQWNALQTLDATGFKLVDPDGLLVEAEYDLGILMREDPNEADLRERARLLATRTGCDETAIWEWGVVERLSTALLATEVDLQPAGDQMLAAAERASAEP